MLSVKLVVVGGATEGDEFQPALPATLGRSRDASIPTPHPLVSRQHCELFEQDRRLFVRDLGSTNGTFVGSERVDCAMVIEHGELLTIGTVTFRAFYDGLPRPDLSSVGNRKHEVENGETESASCSDTSTITRVDAGQTSATLMNGKPHRLSPNTK